MMNSGEPISGRRSRPFRLSISDMAFPWFGVAAALRGAAAMSRAGRLRHFVLAFPPFAGAA
jgi:hypothetical protein